MRPAGDLRPEEVEEIRRTFVAGHPAMVEAHEAYRVLRGAGLAVPTSATVGFAEALACTGLEDRATTFWAG